LHKTPEVSTGKRYSKDTQDKVESGKVREKQTPEKEKIGIDVHDIQDIRKKIISSDLEKRCT